MTITRAVKDEVQIVDLFQQNAETGAKVIPMTISKIGMGKIMKSLTDLYKNPVLATVRETISNALDATAALARDGSSPKPVEINSPSQLNPYFTVRDHGVGMTPKIIANVFAKYGATTKDFSDDETGSAGLGAKSPLSYVDEFFFETTCDGNTSEVSVSRESTGPLTKILRVKKTNQPSGTIMRIPVNDYTDSIRSEFQEAINVYRDYAFTMGQKIVIDGVVQEGNDSYHLFDEIIIEKESQRKGRVWINVDELQKLLFEINNNNEKVSRYQLYGNPDFVISGFRYKAPHNYYSSTRSLFMIELVPNVVNFSPSRDDIINDDHYRVFEELISKQLFENNSYYKAALSYYRTLDNRSAYELLTNLSSVSSREAEGRFFFTYPLEDWGTSLPAEFSVNIDELVTDAGYDPLKEDQVYSTISPFLGLISVEGSKNVFKDFCRDYYCSDDPKKEKKSTVSFDKITISKIKEHLLSNLNQSNSGTDVYGLIKASALISSKLRLIERDEGFVVISVDSEKDIAFALRNRNYIKKADHFFFVRGDVEEELQRIMIDRTKSISEHIWFRFTNIDEMRKEVAEMRSLQEKAKKDVEPVFSVKEYSVQVRSEADVFSFDLETIKAVSKYKVSEIIERNPIIFIVSAKERSNFSYLNAMNDLYYSEGEKVFNRPIMRVDNPKKDFFEALKEHSSFFVSSDKYKARSKIESELLSDRRFNRPVGQDLAYKIPLSNREKIVFQQYFINPNFVSNLGHLKKLLNRASYEVSLESLRVWTAENSTCNISAMMHDIDRILSCDDYKSGFNEKISANEIKVEDIVKTISNNSLLLLKTYAMIANKIASPSSYFYSDTRNIENELQSLILAYSRTDSKSVRSVVVQRIDEIVGEATVLKGDEEK